MLFLSLSENEGSRVAGTIELQDRGTIDVLLDPFFFFFFFIFILLSGAEDHPLVVMIPSNLTDPSTPLGDGIAIVKRTPLPLPSLMTRTSEHVQTETRCCAEEYRG